MKRIFKTLVIAGGKILNKIKIKKIIFCWAVFLAVLWLIFYLLSIKRQPAEIVYGVSFSKFHSDELKLDWKEAYLAILNDLGVRNFRFSAHWPLVEPENDKFNFTELDFQMEQAKDKNAQVILAVGRRLPGWPECHVPDWARKDEDGFVSSSSFNKGELLEYVQTVVERYKSYPNLKYWQVENELFLPVFAGSFCGKLDEKLLKEEIELIKRLDPAREILITDSGELGLWVRAKKAGDVFGTSMYLYIWSPIFGKVRYPITPAFFRIKQNIAGLLSGKIKQKNIIIELSAEPWLLHPIVETPLELQFERMGTDKFQEVINFARKTAFGEQYLWGTEWWYWLKVNGYPEHWEKAKELFKS